MKTRLLKLLISTVISGFVMWFIGGLWHNLILPHINNNAQAHHEGLHIMLIAYFILALFMGYLYIISYKEKDKQIIKGLKIGVIVGILWVFPHGLAMAGAHGTSIIYEIKNTIYHVIEQGIGGIIISFIQKKYD